MTDRAVIPAALLLIAASAPGGPQLDQHVRVIGPNGLDTSLTAMLDEAAQADVVFLGETHLDDVTHRVELAVLEGLDERRGGRVVLAMEMFATDVQQSIDRYLAGEIDEPQFVIAAGAWKNYRTGYRPLVEYAKVRGLPVIGSNIPTDLRRTIAVGGREAYESLPAEEQGLVPPRLLPGSVEYWQRYERAVASHSSRAGSDGPMDPMDYLYTSQSLWDNTMGWSCARALEEHPGFAVLHVNGGFHSKYGQGTVEQLRKRRPGVKVLTISVIPTADLTTIDVRDAGRAADYLVFAEARARGLKEGFHAVSASREIRYRVHLPEARRADATFPLLIWLGEEGLRAEDNETWWSAALGPDAIVATVEPPYLQVEEDLHLGGRWYWTETFHDDVGAVVQALERMLPYLVEHFPVDRARVAVGGAGTGATVVLVAALLSDRLPVRALALDPRETSKLIEVSLPDLPPATERLTVLVDETDQNRWESTCVGYGTAGLAAAVATVEGDGYVEIHDQVRETLGLDRRPVRPVPSGSGDSASPLERHWRRLQAMRGVEVPKGPITIDDLGDVEAIPVPAGPFGGTTVVVVPRDAAPDARSVWKNLESSGAMEEAHGRFHHLAVAFEDEAPRLDEVLDDLEGRGRRNVLIVPAVFYAGSQTMRELRDQAAAHADRMTISWLPGLGGSLPVQ